jgi:endoglucanase
MDLVAHLKQLTMATGLSGYEAEVRGLIQNAWEPLADAFHTDALGNLIALKRGARPDGAPTQAIMLAAHMDEIGLMITGYEGSFLRFRRVGGVDLRTILGQEVTVHGRRDLAGVISSRPPHVLSEQDRRTAVPDDKLFIDVGLTASELSELVQIGDLASMRRETIELADGYLSGKAMDDRAGVATLTVCLQELSRLRHEWDVYAVATTQEEIGLRGAIVSAYSTAPTAGIAVDVGFGAQLGVSEDESIEMDGGPAIALGPNVHPRMHEALVKAAQEHELKYQIEVAPGATGTDAWAIQVTREGVPTALLSVPLRYMHTSVETVCVRDVQRTGRLLALLIASLDEAFATSLAQ